MNFENQIWEWMLLFGVLLITGWVYNMLYGQAEDEVLIRNPNTRRYSPSVSASTTATTSWEYAVLSGNSYLNYWSGIKDPAPWKVEKGKLPQEDCWEEWKEFSENTVLSKAAHNVGLYGEVWEKKSSSPRLIAVVFRGTDASLIDWRSNLRWILRFVPFYSFMKDQYTVIAKEFVTTFLDQLAGKIGGMKGAEYTAVQIIATGHSLGGGLAQYFAYALPVTSNSGIKLPRVSPSVCI